MEILLVLFVLIGLVPLVVCASELMLSEQDELPSDDQRERGLQVLDVYFQRYKDQYGRRAKKCNYLAGTIPNTDDECQQMRIGDYTCLFGETTCNSTGLIEPNYKCECSKDTLKWICSPYDACGTTEVFTSCPVEHPLSLSVRSVCQGDFNCDYGLEFCCDQIFPVTNCKCQDEKFICEHYDTCRDPSCSVLSTDGTAAPSLTATATPTTFSVEPTESPEQDQETAMPTQPPVKPLTSEPTGASVEPSVVPTFDPTVVPVTPEPSSSPTLKASSSPTSSPTLTPTTLGSTLSPTAFPTIPPVSEPTFGPTNAPTARPTPRPTDKPSQEPSPNPTLNPTSSPTESLTLNPTEAPTIAPIPSSTNTPTSEPSVSPTAVPITPIPTESPTAAPITPMPTVSFTAAPSAATPAVPGGCSKSVSLDSDLTLDYVLSDKTLDATLTLNGLGFIGFGRSVSGGMVTSEVVIGNDEGVKKYYLGGRFVGAIVDDRFEQTLTDTSFSQNVTHTIVKWKKLLIEEGELPIENGSNIFIYAYGGSNALAYHGPNRGSITIDLASC